MSRWLLFAIALPVWAHVVSISTGELKLDGPLATYELRIPMYEVAQLPHPETLLDHITFATAQRVSLACHDDHGTFVCLAQYEFPGLVDRVQADCTFFQVTVPNHVHLLRAEQGSNTAEAVFDQSFTHAEMRFHPPSRLEVLVRELSGGIARALLSPVALFLFVLALAARSPREAVVLTSMYLAGEGLMRPIAPHIPWTLSPRFIEAAMALTVAYLALELVLLPKAGARWAIVLIVGLFHGLYFAAFPATYLVGAALIQTILITLLTWMALRWLTPKFRRPVAILALLASLAWFATRVI